MLDLLKPVDFQTLLPRTMDLQRIQQVQNIRPHVDQHEFSREAIRQSQERQEQVQQNDASKEGNRIHDDALDDHKNRERRYRRYGQKPKKNSEEESLETAPDSERGQHIDIKI